MGSEVRQKTKLIQVRATPEEKSALKNRADAFGISMGELCRETIFGAKPKSKTDQLAIAELATTRADLARLGNMLRGWLGTAFPYSPAPDRKQVRDLIREIDVAKAKVTDAAKSLMGTV